MGKKTIDWDEIVLKSLEDSSVITEEELLKSLRKEFKLERGRYLNPVESVAVTKKLLLTGVLKLTTPEMGKQWQKGTRTFRVDLSKLGKPAKIKNKKEKIVATTTKTEATRKISIKTKKFTLKTLSQFFNKVEDYGEDREGYTVFGIELNAASAKVFLAEIAPKLSKGEDQFDATTPDKFQDIVWRVSDYCEENKE